MRVKVLGDFEVLGKVRVLGEDGLSVVCVCWLYPMYRYGYR